MKTQESTASNYLSAKVEPKKVIAICQSRGNFELGEDGLMSFNGGEAYAVDLDQQTQLSKFKQEIAETFKYSDEDMSINKVSKNDEEPLDPQLSNNGWEAES
ncbi:hypothetical protein ACET3Z_029857 [Daucus carota]